MAPGRPGGPRSRRVSLPGVAELLRQASSPSASTAPESAAPAGSRQRPASGRERHTEKITVYLSVPELLDLERARLALRSYLIQADRGRIVREAIAVLLADLDAEGPDSVLARRLRQGG